jgi:subtilisin family serine protease
VTDPDLTYVNSLTGRRHTFTPAAQGVMVRLAEPAAGVPPGARRAGGPRGVALVAAREPARSAAALADRPDVARALPVLVDDEGNTRHFVPGELTVQFREGVGREAAERVLAELGSRVIRDMRTPGYHVVAVPEGMSAFAAIRALAGRPEVRFAEPSEVSYDSAFLVPQDPDFPKLWALRNTGQSVRALRGSPGADIRATEAWDVTMGDPEVIVVVVDTGVDLDHPDLAANLLDRGGDDWDFADAADPSPDDTEGHGSHVAGTAAAPADATGVVGVAPRCRIMPVRVDLGDGMSENRADALNHVTALARAASGRRFVVNCSWGISGDHAGVLGAIRAALAAEALVVFACGNSHRDIDAQPQYPASYPETVAVAATDHHDRRTWFTNYGAAVDVSAPGLNIWSASLRGRHSFLDGTSMAAPHASGVAALVWSRNRGLGAGEVRAILEGSCDDVDALNPDVAGRLGRGRVNAARAVAATPAP